MKKLIMLMIMLLVLSGCSPKPFSYEVKPKESEIKIAVTSDIHYLDPTLMTGSSFTEMLESSDGKLTKYVSEITDAFIDDCITEQVDIVIISGDLTFNGEILSHTGLAKKLQRLYDAGIQPLVVPGNHDINNINASDFTGDVGKRTEFTTPEEFADIYKDCGYGQALYRDEESLSYLFEASEDCWLLMLDTNRWEDNNSFTAEATGRIRDEQFVWIENILKEAKEKNIQVISVTHQNLIQQTDAKDYALLNAPQLQALYDEYDVVINLSGHIHAQNYKQLQMTNNLLTDIASSSLDVYDHHFGIINLIPHDFFDYQTRPIDMQAYIEKNNISDEFLNNFEENSRAYFKEFSVKRLAGHYNQEGIDEQVSKSIEELKGELNLYVFSGRVPAFREQFVGTELYELIKTLNDDTQSSILGPLSSFDHDANSLKLDLKPQE